MAIVILGFPSAIGFGAAPALAAEPTPAEVLARLRAKDQQFDNAKLEIILFEQWNIKPFPA
jgi:hypothetical protein